MARPSKQTGGRRPLRTRYIGPLHRDELAPADPEVLRMLDVVQSARRRQCIAEGDLLAVKIRGAVLRREQEREQMAWDRLARYLSDRTTD